MIDEEQRQRHARSSLRLTAIAIGLLCALALVLPLAAPLLNGYSFLRFPLGLFLATHGAVIGFVVLISRAASEQDWLDRRYGMTSDL